MAQAQMIATGPKGATYASHIVYSFEIIYLPGIGETFGINRKWQLYCDPHYILAVPPEQVAWDLLHEACGHVMGEHADRGDTLGVTGDEDLKTWNIACDIAANGELFALAAVSDGALRPMGAVIALSNLTAAKAETTVCTAERYCFPPDLTAEAYYKLLKTQANKPKPQPSPQPSPRPSPGQSPGSGQAPSGDGQPAGQPSFGQSPGQSAGQSPGQSGDGQPKHRSCGGCAGDDAATDALEKQARDQGVPMGDGRDPVEQTLALESTAKAIKEAANGRGYVPAGWVRWAELTLRPPKVDWRRNLRAMIAAGVGMARGHDDFTFTRLRERGSVLLPTMYRPTPTVAMVLDTSGSMSDSDIGRSMNELRGIFTTLQAGGATQVFVTACDSRATKPVKFTAWNAAKITSVLRGGGGTDMGAGITAAATVRPSITVVATDGDTDWPPAKPKGAGKVIVCLTRQCSMPIPAWATVVRAYEED